MQCGEFQGEAGSGLTIYGVSPDTLLICYVHFSSFTNEEQMRQGVSEDVEMVGLDGNGYLIW